MCDICQRLYCPPKCPSYSGRRVGKEDKENGTKTKNGRIKA